MAGPRVSQALSSVGGLSPAMRRWLGNRLLLIAFVPISSLLGLARPMKEVGGRVFIDVWVANFWGDLVFTAGTIAAGLAVGLLVSRALKVPDPSRTGLLIASVGLSFVLHWAVYALSWSITSTGLFREASLRNFFSFDFQMASYGENSWNFT